MEDSNIEWTDHTWNVWEGCTKISAACERCYAENEVAHRYGRVTWGPGGDRRRIVSTWNAPREWHRKSIENGRRARVFCSSLSDIFDDHPSIQQAWRDHLWQTIRDTPMLDWLLLTKRPENFECYLPHDWGFGYPHVTLMVTAENQVCAERRLPLLTAVPAHRRGVSIEPLIGRVDLSPWISSLDWVIAGGETLTGARPMNPGWVREIRDLSREYEVPFFFKQWGWWTPEPLPNAKERHVFPGGDIVYYRGNKKLNGNHLDGRQILEHPFRTEITEAEKRFLAEEWPGRMAG